MFPPQTQDTLWLTNFHNKYMQHILEASWVQGGEQARGQTVFCLKKAEIRHLQLIFKGKRTAFSLSAGGFQY